MIRMAAAFVFVALMPACWVDDAVTNALSSPRTPLSCAYPDGESVNSYYRSAGGWCLTPHEVRSAEVDLRAITGLDVAGWRIVFLASTDPPLGTTTPADRWIAIARSDAAVATAVLRHEFFHAALYDETGDVDTRHTDERWYLVDAGKQ